MDLRTRTSPWLTRRRERGGAALHVYVFAHAGGSCGEYLAWGDLVPEVQFWGVQLPGRSVRRAEDAHTSVGALVGSLVGETRFAGPFVLLGHSFGGLLAYETARALRRLGREMPEQVILSSCPAPHSFGGAEPARWLHTLPDDDLITAAEARWGPLPEQVHGDARLRRLVLAPLRADIQLFETYAHAPGPPLDVPATLLCGTEEQDRLAGESAGWGRWLSRVTRRLALPGGHFYFREDPGPLLDVVRMVAGEVREARSTRRPRPAS
ncbi:thioesterase II family protein [Streptomyces sp. NPDC057249]|uniref:thioesterase II family protein n=1 Tax=Streptomyces sp. NPDC057249 TaxID=3346067 RepID=UPI003637D538